MTTTFAMTRNQIIHKAFRKAGLIADGEQPSPEQMHEAADDLNLIIKNLEKYRRKLWAVEELTQTLDVPDQVQYSGKSYACTLTHTAALTDTPDLLAQWVEIDHDASLDAWASGTSYIGSSFAVPAGTTAIESVIAYPTASPHVRTQVDIINRFEDIEIPDKTIVGEPEGIYFRRYPEPGRVFIYPIPDRPLTLVYSRIRLLEDVTTADQFPDIPVTLIAYLIYELAAEMAEEYDREEPKITRLRNKAQAELALAIRNQKEYSDDSFVEPAY